MLLSFSLEGVVGQHCKKMLEKNKLKEEGFILTHGFRDLSQWLAGSIALVIMAGKVCQSRTAYLMVARRPSRQNIVFKCFNYLLYPIKAQLLSSPLIYEECIKPLMSLEPL
jgi:hypothetical protein